MLGQQRGIAQAELGSNPSGLYFKRCGRIGYVKWFDSLDLLGAWR